MIRLPGDIDGADLEKAAFELLGTTDNIDDAGFVLPDGTLINLNRSSKERWWFGEPTNQGFMTHDQAVGLIGEHLEISGYLVPTHFMQMTGAVRLVTGVVAIPSAEVVCAGDSPTHITSRQIDTILKMFDLGRARSKRNRDATLYIDVLTDPENESVVHTYTSDFPSAKEILRFVNRICNTGRCTCFQGGLCCGV